MRHRIWQIGVTLLFVTPAMAQQWRSLLPQAHEWSGYLHDTARARTVLFGNDPVAYTWEYDGTHWQPHLTAHEPPRVPAATCYAAGWNRIVLFTASQNTAPETWTYDGTDWAQVITAHVPLRRWNTGMTFDSGRQRAILFGGDSNSSLLYDTWEFDGVDWHAIGVPNPPAVRTYHALGYDPVRQRTVLHGGRTLPFVTLHDTWEYDGTAWTQIPTANTPPAASGMFWHPMLQRLVMMFGSTLWLYDGTNWSQSTIANLPSWQGGVVYDDARNRLVMFGSNETWEYDGVAWERRTQAPPQAANPSMATDQPNQRVAWYGESRTWAHDASGWHAIATTGVPTIANGVLAHDPRRDAFLLFGGAAQYPPADCELWELHGAVWQPVLTPQAPPFRAAPGFAFDARRHRAVVFGGTDGQGSVTRYADTWEYDGANWQQVFTPVAPAARSRAAMAFDPSNGCIVLFGGDDGSLTPRPDTWLYDQSGWRQLLTPHAPFGTWDAAFAHDPWRGRLVLHGGDPGNGGTSSELWEFDGADWSQLAPTGANLALRKHAMTFDPASNEVILAGGTLSNGAIAGTNSWTLHRTPAALWARFGSGCPGSAGRPELSTPVGSVPQLGSTLVLQLDNLPSGPGVAWLAFGFGIDRWLGQALPYDLAGFGMPGCQLWIAPATGLGALMLPTGTHATYALALPSAPSLAGQRFGIQAFVLDPATNGGFALSNAALATMY